MIVKVIEKMLYERTFHEMSAVFCVADCLRAVVVARVGRVMCGEIPDMVRLFVSTDRGSRSPRT